jgi:integrase
MQSRSNVRAKKRARVRIDPRDESRLLRALDAWADTGNLVALRTRALVLLLWDGAVRTSAALGMNIEDAIDHDARLPTVANRIVVRPPEESGPIGRTVVLSGRAQDALTKYLRAAKKGGWLPGGQLRGPVFLASMPRGAGQRLSQRSAIHWWELFQRTHAPDCSQEYELDDVVYTGRLAYAEASGGDAESLSDHAGISRRWAAEYRSDHKLSPTEVMKKLEKRRR